MSEERKQIEHEKEMIHKNMEELDKMLTSNIPKEDYLLLTDTSGDTLEIMPGSTSFEVAHEKFNEPFFLLMKDCDFKDSVSVGLNLEQAIQLRDFLNEKIEIINNIKK